MENCITTLDGGLAAVFARLVLLAAMLVLLAVVIASTIVSGDMGNSSSSNDSKDSTVTTVSIVHPVSIVIVVEIVQAVVSSHYIPPYSTLLSCLLSRAIVTSLTIVLYMIWLLSLIFTKCCIIIKSFKLLELFVFKRNSVTYHRLVEIQAFVWLFRFVWCICEAYKLTCLLCMHCAAVISILNNTKIYYHATV